MVLYDRNNIYLNFVICFILIFAIVLSFTLIPYADTLALPYLAFNPAAAILVGKLLIAAGLTFATYYAAKATVDYFARSTSSNTVLELNTIAETAPVVNSSYAVADVPNHVWESVKTFANTNFTVNENIIKAVEGSHYPVDINGQSYNVHLYQSSIPYGYTPYGTTFQYGDDFFEIVRENWTSNQDRFRLRLNGSSYVGTNVYTYKGGPSPQFIFLANSQYGTLTLSYVYVDINGDIKVQHGVYGLQNPTISLRDAYQSLTGSLTDNIVIGADVLTNPAWDFKNEETDKREIGFPIDTPFPDVLGGLVDKTYEDIINEGAGTDNPPGTGVVNPPLDLTVPETATLNFEPLKLKVPLSSTFPFSIPFDLKNAIENLNAPRSAPKFEVDLLTTHIVIDFAQFEQLAKIVRWGVLITFNLSLILATRRLIKG